MSSLSSKTGADSYTSVLDTIAEFRQESQAKCDKSIGKLDTMQSKIEKVRDEISKMNIETMISKLEPN